MTPQCAEHKDLINLLSEIKDNQAKQNTDIALIKQSLLGNPDKNDGLVDKVNKHDTFFYIVYGMIILVSFAIANVSLIKNV